MNCTAHFRLPQLHECPQEDPHEDRRYYDNDDTISSGTSGDDEDDDDDNDSDYVDTDDEDDGDNDDNDGDKRENVSVI